MASYVISRVSGAVNAVFSSLGAFGVLAAVAWAMAWLALSVIVAIGYTPNGLEVYSAKSNNVLTRVRVNARFEGLRIGESTIRQPLEEDVGRVTVTKQMLCSHITYTEGEFSSARDASVVAISHRGWQFSFSIVLCGPAVLTLLFLVFRGVRRRLWSLLSALSGWLGRWSRVSDRRGFPIAARFDEPH